ncbi:lipid asymmetry maintenance ABC transporter permease subunit MlaE [Endozoicomonas sp. G2_2]|uniref:lipid asymmetry maintenance ABC transporter permease subunit MlaE n=1 Tax=Gammaproteobacteria TaxID=1236 RepID=UPI000C629DD9|nr:MULTISPECIES: lipid asymmetry maintenance ABC transporter permease subunit MlaE [Gammaproteobacteria]MAS09853.1 ABC transporter permease [Salinisphaera sp.]MBO9471186.1 lipid asymmetry maintenance ABC transporter permease subunit MlaE [Endozoicomonas sp. G2_2]
MTTMQRGFNTATGWMADLGRGAIFLMRILFSLPGLILKPRLLIEQIYSVGVLSLVIVVVAGVFVGMVLALSGYRLLVGFGAEEALGTSVALVVVRELGPVVTGLLFAGRAGSALAAEIGLMKATDQLSGMEMMAVDPVKRIVAPRFLAGVIALPLLTSIFCVMAIGAGGGYFVGVDMLGVDAGSYWSGIQSNVDFGEDIINIFLKSGVFGAIITWVAVYQGYHAPPTSEGVSRATTNTVVIASLAILGANLMLTAVLFGSH